MLSLELTAIGSAPDLELLSEIWLKPEDPERETRPLPAPPVAEPIPCDCKGVRGSATFVGSPLNRARPWVAPLPGESGVRSFPSVVVVEFPAETRDELVSEPGSAWLGAASGVACPQSGVTFDPAESWLDAAILATDLYLQVPPSSCSLLGSADNLRRRSGKCPLQWADVALQLI